MKLSGLTQDQVDQFLKELTELTIKHKVQIGGCGCCGSPYLGSPEEEGEYKVDPESFDWLGWKDKPEPETE